MTPRRALLAGTASLVAAPSLAQTPYPTRPITLVVGFAPGGSSDAVARMVAEVMARQLGQPIVVENRPGAAGTIAHAGLARARPDGYTIMLSGLGLLTTLPHLMPNRGYDEQRDFAPIGLFAVTPAYLCAHPRLPARTLAELIAMAKAQPGRLNYGSSGGGSSAHIAMELLLSRAGIEIQNVTYRGGAPAVQALIANEVQVAFVDGITALPLIQGGQVRALAVSMTERFPLTPDVPAIAESFPGFEVASQFGFIAPARTPEPIIERLWSTMETAMRDPALLERLLAAAYVPRLLSPQAFAARIAEETPRWAEVIRERRITAD
jgi:tripartite-type tricarboxylate transporter receptor subunit TctC